MESKKSELSILHVDMDAFYAAVEVLDDPSLKGKPVIVGGSPTSRGVVCSATYEARKFGVKSAMPTAHAFRLCPQGLFLPLRMERYVAISRQVMSIFRAHTPLVEPLSLDEAFLDTSGTERLFGDAPAAGRRIKDAIRRELGLVASVGVSFNKFLAKLASDLEKPDGFVVIRPEDVRRSLDPLPVDRLWGVGVKTVPRLHELGLKTFADVRGKDESWLADKLGELGTHIAHLARGEDFRRVEPSWEAKSLGADRTFGADLTTIEDMEAELLAIAEDVGTRARADGVTGRTLQLKVRFHDFRTITRSRTLEVPTDITSEIYDAARQLLRDRAGVKGKRVRLLGIQLQQLNAPEQGLLFRQKERDRQRKVNQVLDDLRKRHGEEIVTRGRASKRLMPGEFRPKLDD